VILFVFTGRHGSCRPPGADEASNFKSFSPDIDRPTHAEYDYPQAMSSRWFVVLAVALLGARGAAYDETAPSWGAYVYNKQPRLPRHPLSQLKLCLFHLWKQQRLTT
jgi:hypothetical protein